jgi:DNA modification methylase
MVGMHGETKLNSIITVVGDALEYTKLLPSNSINLIIIDPPYNTTSEMWDKQDAISETLVKELYRVLKDTGNIYIWCGIGEKSQSLIRWYPLFSSIFIFKDLITWKKKRGIGMRRGWLYTREELMWLVKDNHRFIWNKEFQYSSEPNQFKVGMSGYSVKPFKRHTNVWTDIPEYLGKKNTSHYTPKPIEDLERIILLHTFKDDIVYDCFMGSGSTLIAANNLGRHAIGVDINEEYIREFRNNNEST